VLDVVEVLAAQADGHIRHVMWPRRNSKNALTSGGRRRRTP
jgi:hypothetical protein